MWALLGAFFFILGILDLLFIDPITGIILILAGLYVYSRADSRNKQKMRDLDEEVKQEERAALEERRHQELLAATRASAEKQKMPDSLGKR